MLQRLKEELHHLKTEKLERHLLPNQGIDFASNDYLALSTHSAIREAIIEYLEKNISLGATGSRLLRGNTELHTLTEDKLKGFKLVPATVIFNSGYDANFGILTTLATKNTQFFSDQLNHASIIDGIRHTQCKKYIYNHRDMNHLESLLKESNNASQNIIVSETLFSMDGDFAPINDLCLLANEYDALLVLDEAHATGVFGSNGSGLTEELDYNNFNLVSVHTCGKAIGSFGAFVACSSTIKNYLIHHCRNFIYSTALPPLTLAHWNKAIDIIRDEPLRRIRVLENSCLFRKRLNPYYDIDDVNSQIVPIPFNNIEETLITAAYLCSHGFDVRAIRYPTVSKDTPRLRISIHSDHQRSDIIRLADLLVGARRGILHR